MSESIIERFNERIAIGINEGELNEFEATRQAYFEIKRIFGELPGIVKLEWKRVYETEMKKNDQQG